MEWNTRSQRAGSSPQERKIESVKNDNINFRFRISSSSMNVKYKPPQKKNAPTILKLQKHTIIQAQVHMERNEVANLAIAHGSLPMIPHRIASKYDLYL